MAADGVPVIDGRRFLATENADTPPPPAVCAEVGAACKAWGTFQLVNHGVDEALLARMDAAMQAFFALPADEKRAVKRDQSNAYGYFDDEFTKQSLDLKEGFDFAHVPHPELPESDPLNHSFKDAMKAWEAEMQRCSYKLLEAFCLGLGLPAAELHPLQGRRGQRSSPGPRRAHGAFLRAARPPHGFALLVLRAAPPRPLARTDADACSHASPSIPPDAGFLTILVQGEVAGLEMEHAGEWRLVEPIPGALTINVGDMCQVVSNDLVRAPQHRVLSPHEKVRYSAPFFFNPSLDAVLAPVLVSAARPAAYRPIRWGEFRAKRFAGDYADVGEEVQIAHYRITDPFAKLPGGDRLATCGSLQSAAVAADLGRLWVLLRAEEPEGVSFRDDLCNVPAARYSEDAALVGALRAVADRATLQAFLRHALPDVLTKGKRWGIGWAWRQRASSRQRSVTVQAEVEIVAPLPLQPLDALGSETGPEDLGALLLAPSPGAALSHLLRGKRAAPEAALAAAPSSEEGTEGGSASQRASRRLRLEEAAPAMQLLRALETVPLPATQQEDQYQTGVSDTLALPSAAPRALLAPPAVPLDVGAVEGLDGRALAAAVRRILRHFSVPKEAFVAYMQRFAERRSGEQEGHGDALREMAAEGDGPGVRLWVDKALQHWGSA
eukprot:scaffold23.g4141.t1